MLDTMSLTQTLSVFFGLYFFAAGLGLLLDRESIAEMMNGFSTNPAIGFITGLITFLIGATVVATHNQWNTIFEILISVFGWVALIEGLLMLAFRKWFLSLAASFTNSKTFLVAGGYLAVLMGIGFLLAGFDIDLIDMGAPV